MLRLYNSLSRKVENFKSLQASKAMPDGRQVGMYTCGPTVYQYAHIGNFRAYLVADILVRTLKANKFDVNFIMNITDVGHLVSDADTGEDKLEKSAKKEGKTAWEIAKFYTDAFLNDYDALSLTRPTVLAKATDHIAEQIDLVKRLEEKGYTYTISDGVYFDTAKFPEYGELSTLDQIKEGARVEANSEKRNPRDFALWKFSPHASKRDMEWESPWGKGFPGWHIECSAMSMKYLGDTLDIHTGGIDHISIHHTNEIAQSEAATGKKFVNFWTHVAFLLVGGQKVSKSLGNGYLLSDLRTNGYKPLHLRYLYLQTHYRQEMNFTWESLEAAKNAVDRLHNTVFTWTEGEKGTKEFETLFLDALNDDLSTPKALAVMWDMLKADVPTEQKLHSLFKMDEVLGLGLKRYLSTAKGEIKGIPAEVTRLIEDRKKARLDKDFARSDELRDQIRALGFDIQDNKEEVEIRKVTSE
ncbi:MAG: cysteine--tRNA ligase [Candidatus Levybacteria bacterium]|nr:cysteine--tRNA ligase [Candidatus Levybacteria bacterium]